MPHAAEYGGYLEFAEVKSGRLTWKLLRSYILRRWQSLHGNVLKRRPDING